MRWLLAVVLAGCGSSSPKSTAPPAGAAAPAAAASPDEVTLTTSDGVTIAATYTPGPAGSDRGVIFVHQLSSKRAEWAPFVEALRGKLHALAIDMRGHGASTRGPSGPITWNAFQQADWEAVALDVEAATRFLADKGVSLERTVIVGSSIGSSAALRFAGDHPGVAGVVLLSPGLKYRGVDTVAAAKQYGKPKLVVYSSDAEDAARGLEQLWKRSATLRKVPGKAHGVKMLADDPGIVDAVVAFIEQTTR